jgi:hypothetical protein
VLEKVVISGDLAELNVPQRADYYTAVCRSLGLNPLTKPFEFLTLNGKLRLYALRDCADQLRRIHGISISIASRERMNDIYIVTARAKDRTGREDESTGAVPLGNLRGDALANALMKVETKAKRRVTLSIAGLGWLDETELETIPQQVTTPPVGSPHPLPEGEETPHGPTEVHPTADEITTLVDSARAANISNDDFAHDMRRLRAPLRRHGGVQLSCQECWNFLYAPILSPPQGSQIPKGRGECSMVGERRGATKPPSQTAPA